MENDRCVLITRKEYEELKAKAEQAKPNEIEVQVAFNMYYREATIRTYGTIDLSANLQRQIRRITAMIGEENRQQMSDEVDRICDNERMSGYNDAMAEFAGMSWFKRLVFQGKAKAKTYMTL